MPDPLALQPCDRCRQPTLAALLTPGRKAFLRTPYRHCINCHHDLSRRTEFYLLAAFLLPILLLPVALLFRSTTLPHLFAFLAAVSAFCLTYAPLHEAAHALAALLLGHHLPCVSIGGDLPFLTLRIRSTRIRFSGWGGSGYCAHYAFPKPPRPSSDTLILLAGPASHLLCALLFPALLSTLLVPFPDAGPLLTAPIFIFAGGHLALFLFNAYPRYRRGRPQNDGAIFFDRRRRYREHPGRAAADHAAGAVAWAVAGNDLHAARQLLAAAAAGHLESPYFLYQHCHLLALDNRWPDLLSLLQPALPALPPEVRPYAAQLVLLAHLHDDAPQALNAAAALLPELQPARHLALTLRALLLFRQGNTDDALARLRHAGLVFPSVEAAVFAHTTLAALHDRLGSSQQAARHRRRTHHLGPAPAVPKSVLPTLQPSPQPVNPPHAQPGAEKV